jgi:hypothetical protein
MSTQLRPFDAGQEPPRQRKGPPRIKRSKVTSVQLTPDERDLLEQLADAKGVGLGELWRSALRAYARQQGVLTDAEEGRVAA